MRQVNWKLAASSGFGRLQAKRDKQAKGAEKIELESLKLHSCATLRRSNSAGRQSAEEQRAVRGAELAIDP